LKYRDNNDMMLTPAILESFYSLLVPSMLYLITRWNTEAVE